MTETPTLAENKVLLCKIEECKLIKAQLKALKEVRKAILFLDKTGTCKNEINALWDKYSKALFALTDRALEL
ncbi:hypothetical protein [Parasutterella muris]|uniref:Uncharacterized protein n=1 Tax=Parasutterella muris TaxID=2565572 RepID=A0A6L6YJC5_9BURK|nr:hypothetical protein [Parasutterella muris]MVX56849.1 hypothetical protein [Parasutterella muris]